MSHLQEGDMPVFSHSNITVRHTTIVLRTQEAIIGARFKWIAMEILLNINGIGVLIRTEMDFRTEGALKVLHHNNLF